MRITWEGESKRYFEVLLDLEPSELLSSVLYAVVYDCSSGQQ